MKDFIFIYTTFASKEEAKKISHELIEKKLAACANIWPINSVYKWQRKVQDSQEWVAIIKTKKNYFTKVEEFIVSKHSYDTPCIIEIPVGQVAKKYSDWLSSCF